VAPKPPVVEPVAAPPEVVPAPVAAPVETHARPRHLAARVEVAPPPAATDDPTLVATALRALRREHDPARAGALVEDYLRQWPNGALTEEAMALAVEAAAARHDARAAAWADRYLRRFPNGRFRDAVSASARTPAP
ncbi:MAG TPA: hypothetical protein VHJ20_04180, partial [Polyangia bacterium]|nr:hypothetical protein [Polyangia bacterium]